MAIATLEDLRTILKGMPLENAQLAELPILETDETALAIEVNSANAESAWHQLRNAVERTERWPVLIVSWMGSASSWPKLLQEEDLFMRFPYSNELDQKHRNEYHLASSISKSKGISLEEAYLAIANKNLHDLAAESESIDEQLKHLPSSIIAASERVNLEQSLQAIARRIYEEERGYFQDILECYLDETRNRFGSAPDTELLSDLVANKTIQHSRDLEKWLFSWEISNFSDATLSISDDSSTYLEWFDVSQNSVTLMLLPTSRCWEVPAYLSWYGSESCSSELVIALLKHWHDKYGAELVSHYGTMLQFITRRVPETPEEAFQLAWEQATIAPCTIQLPGVSIRDHARSILHTKKWFIHERP
ncbi:MAG: DUF4253 domain-containing protein [Cyanobacteria bacterium P01_F01_bin.33]